MTDLAPVLDKNDTDDPEKVAHIINQRLPGNSIADASIFGTEVIALCGHKFIPTRDPQKLPTCGPCKFYLEATT